MGEARRRADQGLPPRQYKGQKDQSPKLIPWIPFTLTNPASINF